MFNIKGRSKQNDIVLKDYTISRFHSTIHYDYGQFYIHDNNSKYGTMLLLKDKIQLNLNVDVGIFVNKFVFIICLKSL